VPGTSPPTSTRGPGGCWAPGTPCARAPSSGDATPRHGSTGCSTPAPARFPASVSRCASSAPSSSSSGCAGTARPDRPRPRSGAWRRRWDEPALPGVHRRLDGVHGTGGPTLATVPVRPAPHRAARRCVRLRLLPGLGPGRARAGSLQQGGVAGDDRPRRRCAPPDRGAVLHHLPQLPHRCAARAVAPGARISPVDTGTGPGGGRPMSYLGLAALFVALTLPALAVAVVVRRPSRRWWAATGLSAGC